MRASTPARLTGAAAAAALLAGALVASAGTASAGTMSAGATSAGTAPTSSADTLSAGTSSDGGRRGTGHKTLRAATYNLSLNRAEEGELVDDLSTGGDAQAATVAEVIQHANPDVVLLNEFDYSGDADAYAAADLFRENYLEVPQGTGDPVEYPYAFVAPVNTGVPSGFDLNNDGTVGGGDDALGFGLFPGQYGMVVLSKYPIQHDRVRTFQDFRWQDMPGALLPDDPATDAPADWYSAEELAALPLSSKSHWDVPVRVGRDTVHVLAAHPTPPSFDGTEDRNGLRNHDEIRFWADYVRGGRAAGYQYDDAGRRGGLRPGSSFVIVGDYNADPLDGDSVTGDSGAAAIDQLLHHPWIADPQATSAGAPEAAGLQAGANLDHLGDPALDTADFADTAPGNLRVDYVLPSRDLRVRDAGVFWPVAADPLSRLTGAYPFPSSDHRLVWTDLKP
ncbi:Endonuclease/Exonuclease/phosphatase family protein [Promicromonospora umidemergens]|uniref:Endonuclease/exonuclease/phosphatase family protein n=1 Tax=Promicromonospora umidemergens TaxID=629679 RepID=A0ABP8WKF0_9MICO|nr:endonuclease/exonuclease/phosphatase family protein [Promicromonospora umidemergens]MCP2285884.1 Endonuclease/Exonuclease/phosphatase family protein [Promicromonospora umidemergens]